MVYLSDDCLGVELVVVLAVGLGNLVELNYEGGRAIKKKRKQHKVNLDLKKEMCFFRTGRMRDRLTRWL